MSKKLKLYRTLSDFALAFLVWFRNYYSVCSGDSYRLIAKRANRSLYRVKIAINELEAAELLSIWEKGTRHKRIYLNLEKYNELVKPHVFQREPQK